jgi:NAD(P)-dependent dehydrogenase (short-subunit alcohol dehydrogenase family)
LSHAFLRSVGIPLHVTYDSIPPRGLRIAQSSWRAYVAPQSWPGNRRPHVAFSIGIAPQATGEPLLAQDRRTGRAAVVTGAGRGLGRAMALALLKAGHRVFLTSTDMASLEATRRASGADDRAAIAAADLANEQNRSDLVDAAIKTFGRIDILINNAGIPNPPAPQPLDVSLDQMRRLFEVNTFAPIRLTQLVVPGMFESGWGRIIFISTSLNTMLDPSRVAYGMTKASDEAFVAALAKSLSSTGWSGLALS